MVRAEKPSIKIAATLKASHLPCPVAAMAKRMVRMIEATTDMYVISPNKLSYLSGRSHQSAQKTPKATVRVADPIRKRDMRAIVHMSPQPFALHPAGGL
jgi:hypothetical protein